MAAETLDSASTGKSRAADRAGWERTSLLPSAATVLSMAETRESTNKNADPSSMIANLYFIIHLLIRNLVLDCKRRPVYARFRSFDSVKQFSHEANSAL